MIETRRLDDSSVAQETRAGKYGWCEVFAIATSGSVSAKYVTLASFTFASSSKPAPSLDPDPDVVDPEVLDITGAWKEVALDILLS
jgi:hypothetical protein